MDNSGQHLATQPTFWTTSWPICNHYKTRVWTSPNLTHSTKAIVVMWDKVLRMQVPLRSILRRGLNSAE